MHKFATASKLLFEPNIDTQVLNDHALQLPYMMQYLDGQSMHSHSSLRT